LDDSSLSSSLIIAALLVAYALMTLAISTLLNSRPEYGEENRTLGNRRLKLTQQIMATVFLFSMVLVALDGLIVPLAALLPVQWLAYVLVLLPLTLLVTVLGEVVPSSIGVAYAERLAPILRLFINPLVLVLRPLTWLVYHASRLLSKLFGSTDVATSITEEELLTLIDAGQGFEEEERRMIHSVLDLDKTTATEIMVPRIDMIAVEKSTSIAEARQVFLSNGHSRMPVYEENIDNVSGLVYVKDLLEVWHNGDTVVDSVEEITRPAHFVSEDMTADRLLREFQSNKVHMAIVVEEYGGTGGLVTLENLLEKIVGDIQDEYDADEAEEIVQVSDTEYRIDAGIVLDDLNEALDISLADDDVDTLGGYIFNRLERVPEQGETVEGEEINMQIVAVEGRRIREVFVTMNDSNAEEGRESTEDDLPAISPQEADRSIGGTS